jgi:hypothetical protein
MLDPRERVALTSLFLSVDSHLGLWYGQPAIVIYPPRLREQRSAVRAWP